MNSIVSKNQVLIGKIGGGMANPTFKPFYGWLGYILMGDELGSATPWVFRTVYTKISL